jgi:acyl carrier protein
MRLLGLRRTGEPWSSARSNISSEPIGIAPMTEALLEFINRTLPRLDRRGRTWPPVQADTPLFATGLLDSLSILHLLAFVEQHTGKPISDHLVVMKNFQSVAASAATFDIERT